MRDASPSMPELDQPFDFPENIKDELSGKE